jgi:hypothetical protein
MVALPAPVQALRVDVLVGIAGEQLVARRQL